MILFLNYDKLSKLLVFFKYNFYYQLQNYIFNSIYLLLIHILINIISDNQNIFKL